LEVVVDIKEHQQDLGLVVVGVERRVLVLMVVLLLLQVDYQVLVLHKLLVGKVLTRLHQLLEHQGLVVLRNMVVVVVVDEVLQLQVMVGVLYMEVVEVVEVGVQLHCHQILLAQVVPLELMFRVLEVLQEHHQHHQQKRNQKSRKRTSVHSSHVNSMMGIVKLSQ
jgi:hypothetical protein